VTVFVKGDYYEKIKEINFVVRFNINAFYAFSVYGKCIMDEL